MYKSHAKAIRDDCATSPAAFRDVCYFVLATIQEPLERMADAMASIREDGEQSRWLWGMKSQGYRDVTANYLKLWLRCSARMASRNPQARASCIVDIVDTVHGIGTAKAGFVMQLAFGAVGCLDGHNLKRFGLNKNTFAIAPTFKRQRTKLAKAAAYVAMCDQLGGCEFLWDSWCDHVASLRPDVWATGEDVSAAHMVAVSPF